MRCSWWRPRRCAQTLNRSTGEFRHARLPKYPNSCTFVNDISVVNVGLFSYAPTQFVMTGMYIAV